ncbi:MAG TPA: putative molybdenum carrier protein [Gemmataceae bacterium]|nr:putative molybdenum carrier protein [Gemmataceae bacterium]
MIGKINSGGQTGVDQAALRAAEACGIATGGWAPKGWRTEEGPAPWLAEFGLREHPSGDYPDRTRANVRDAGLTLILIGHESDLARGTALTLRVAQAGRGDGIDHYVSVMSQPGAVERCRDVLQWFAEAGGGVVNVAGPRESESPGIGEWAEKFLREVFQQPA